MPIEVDHYKLTTTHEKKLFLFYFIKHSARIEAYAFDEFAVYV